MGCYVTLGVGRWRGQIGLSRQQGQNTASPDMVQEHGNTRYGTRTKDNMPYEKRRRGKIPTMGEKSPLWAQWEEPLKILMGNLHNPMGILHGQQYTCKYIQFIAKIQSRFRLSRQRRNGSSSMGKAMMPPMLVDLLTGDMMSLHEGVLYHEERLLKEENPTYPVSTQRCQR